MPRDTPAGTRLVAADTQILQSRHGSSQRQVLVHEGQAVKMSGRRIDWQRHPAAAYTQLSTWIGRVVAGEDLDQRRLARSVLSDQSVNLSGEHIEVDVLQHRTSSKALGEISCRQDWLVHVFFN